MSEYVYQNHDVGPVTRIDEIRGGYRISMDYTAAAIDEIARRVNEQLDNEIMQRLGLVKPVRCRDCRFHCIGECTRIDEGFKDYWFAIEPDGFCAWGERKEGGDD